MNDLEAVARDLRLSVDTLKLPAELLKQGYHPSFLATYRPDELGHLDAATLARLQRGLERRSQLAKYKEKLCVQGESEGWWQASLNSVVDEAESIAEVDGLTRNIRSRKSSRVLAEKDPRLATLGQALLTMTSAAPSDLVAWVSEQAQTSIDEAGRLLTDTKQWLQILLSEDAQLLHRLGRQILRRGQLSIKLLAEPVDRDTKAKSNELPAAQSDLASETALAAAGNDRTESTPEDEALSASYATLDVESHEAQASPSEEPLELTVSEAATSNGTTETETAEVLPVAEAVLEKGSVDEAASELNVAIDPLLAAFPNTPASKSRIGKHEKKPLPRTPLKQLSPRQRRRKWLRSILQRYSKLRIPLQRIGHYQALMLGRGQRSQIVSIKVDYDRQPMTQLAREALCPGPHPLNSLLMEISEEALQKIILPRLEHDVFAELEEAAHNELTEMAVRHLQDMLQQRPVRGHRILVIDAMGPKTAAVAIVDPHGHVDFTGELSAVSSRADVVAQNVETLGQWIHQYRVSLVAISNGNTRRYLIHTVNELMKQSGDVGLRWTIVDRTGADAYCDTRQALQELPKIAKRHRAAVWLAWRLQDPLIELTKVDPARLRLGSYQRELPQESLEEALLQAVSASVAARGIDVWYSHEKALVCLPGITATLARAIAALRDNFQLSTREKLIESLREQATENQLRQAMGYLRLFGSAQTLDGTMIHPDDYRLAERLIAAGPLTSPPPAPEGWHMPKPAEAAAQVASQPEPGTDEPSTAATTPIDPVVVEGDSPSTEDTPSDLSPPTIVDSTDVGSIADDHQAAPADVLSPAVLVTEPPKSPNALTMAAINPQNPTEPEMAPPLTIDVERLARSWQVGREKMRVVARSLQQPFADSRDARMPIPLLSHVPTLESLRPGLAAWGIVIGVADFGAFVDLGPDCNGLIHVSRLSREYVEDPHEVVQIGDLLQVWVVSVDHDKKRVALSALPPGTEIARRPMTHDESRESSGNAASNRGFSGNRPSTSRPGQASGQAQRGQGQSNRGSRPQGSNAPGSGNRGQGRDRYERREDTGKTRESVPNKPRAKPSQPAPPITEAMQDGREPMRSFSDLMQFIQTKRDEPSKTPPPPSVVPPSPSEPIESSVEETEAKPNA